MLQSVNCVPAVLFQCGFNSFKVRCLVSRYLLLPQISFISRKSVQTLPSIDMEFENLNIKNKVIYNSIKNKLSFLQIKRLAKLENKENCHAKQDDCLPYSLKFIDREYFRETQSNKEETEDAVAESPHINFPYTIKISQTEIFENDMKNDCGDLSPQDDKLKLEDLISDPPVVTGKQWMNDYEKYTEEEMDDSGVESWQLEYGTSNPSVPVSNVPCGGCGALIHCQDYSIPGYLPYEIFKACDDKDLRALTCQRCHFLQNYNTALSVAVDQKSYPALLSKIKDQKALVILMVDLTDFPCSIWPGILDIVGRARPIFLVGNKVDLLWGDSRGWLENVKESLRASFPRAANIVHVSLISAHTGFGVEELINKLHNFWQYKGDVYLVGCTNVGKSTLFNALLQSDYCKVKAVNLVQRATVAPWPGTTLNLLKFPILRPEGWRLYLRTQRLIKENKNKSAEVKLRKEQLRVQKGKIKSPPQLIGHIRCTFQAAISKEEVASEDNFCIPNRKQIRAAPPPGSGLDPNDPELEKSRWLYDTPGVFHNDQILDLLTTEELVLTLPKKTIEPRTYLFKPGWTIFIAGLARLDFVKGISPVRITVFSSMNLPVTICRTADADSVYSSLLGTKYMAVPSGGEARLQEWPNLQQGSEFNLSGICKEKSCADVVFSSAGWISITPEPQEIAKFLPWTPQSRGIHVRHPSLLPFAVSLRGKKVNKLPVYLRTRVPEI